MIDCSSAAVACMEKRMAMVLGKDARNGFDALDCCRVLRLDAGPRLRIAFNAMNDSGQLFGLKTLCNIQLS